MLPACHPERRDTARPCIFSWPLLVQAVAEPVHYGLDDGNDGLQMPAIMAIAESGAVIQFLRHLRVTGRVRHSAIFPEIDATLVETLADELQHPTHAA